MIFLIISQQPLLHSFYPIIVIVFTIQIYFAKAGYVPQVQEAPMIFIFQAMHKYQ